MTEAGEADEDARVAFVTTHTALAAVPFAPELRVFTAAEVTPLWQATEAWLGQRGVAIPFWSVPWAGGQALARWLLDHPERVRGHRVADLACGGGVVALAAARAGAACVFASDLDPVAVTATRLAARANDVAGIVRVRAADACTEGPRALADGCDVILAGDVWYERDAAERFAAVLRAAAAAGALVVTGDPGRSYVPPDFEPLAVYDVPTPWELESAASRRTRVLRVTDIISRSRLAE